MAAVTYLRTITLTTQGSRFKEGPVDARGFDVAGVQARAVGATAWTSGIVEIKSSLFEQRGEASFTAFSSAQTLTTAAPRLRALGESDPGGIRTAGWLDGFVTTAESGVELEVMVILATRGDA